MPPAGDDTTTVDQDITDSILADDDRGMDSSAGTPSPAAGQAAAGNSPQSAQSASPPVTPPPAAGAATGAPAGQPGVAPAQAQALSAREWAAQRLNFPEASKFNDDTSLLQSLVTGFQRQRQELADLQRERALWMARATQPAPAPAPTPAADPLAGFKGPELDPRWMAMVEKDERGNLVPKPGVDPTIVPKLQAALQHRQNLIEKFSADPTGFLTPILEQREQQAKADFEKIVEARLQAREQEQEARSFIHNNQSWLVAHDSTGKPIMDIASGKPLFSNEGRVFVQHLTYANSIGMPPKAQEEYAIAMVKATLAAPLLEKTRVADAGTQARDDAINQLNRRPNQSGSTVGGNPGNNGAQQNPALTLHDRFSQAFAANNITDADVANV